MLGLAEDGQWPNDVQSIHSLVQRDQNLDGLRRAVRFLVDCTHCAGEVCCSVFVVGEVLVLCKEKYFGTELTRKEQQSGLLLGSRVTQTAIVGYPRLRTFLHTSLKTTVRTLVSTKARARQSLFNIDFVLVNLHLNHSHALILIYCDSRRTELVGLVGHHPFADDRALRLSYTSKS